MSKLMNSVLNLKKSLQQIIRKFMHNIFITNICNEKKDSNIILYILENE